MKKHLIALVGMLLFTGAAFAQNHKVRADVPFDFMVKGTAMPAGEYTISRTSDFAYAIQIQGESAIETVLPVPVDTARPGDISKLVFRKYGDRYFLAQIWHAYSNAGEELPVTRLEKELALTDKPQTIVVAALR